MDKKDPLSRFLQKQGFPNEPDVMKPNDTLVFSFAMKSPSKSVDRDKMSAVEQLSVWKDYQEFWCTHKPSITVSVKEDEWLSVGAWVYNNFSWMSGVSFLPHSDHSYQQAPYQECTEEEYNKLLEQIPEVDWSKLSEYEQEDYTVASQELACVGNQCEWEPKSFYEPGWTNPS